MPPQARIKPPRAFVPLPSHQEPHAMIVTAPNIEGQRHRRRDCGGL